MPNNWVQALKVFNEGKTEWCIPRKGSKEYDDIKRFMYGEIDTIQIQPTEQMTNQQQEPIAKAPSKLKPIKGNNTNNNPWIYHVRQFAINRGITYTQALKQAKATYKK
jgi:translation initiation factor 2 gamma subunit (eIF-2gamma)